MRIGFDAKRAFLNKSGLGSYSRNLITALSSNFSGTEFFLYTTKTNPDLYNPSSPNIRLRVPDNSIHRSLPALWRGYIVSKLLVQDGIDVFHGLSHEIPFGFPVKKVRSVVTIHDLIFLKLPYLYKAPDRYIYDRKFRYACRIADRIIAISQQTADDIVEYFGTDRDKIEVIYQGCHPGFYKTLSTAERDEIRAKYKLPESFILFVGTIEERKNLLSLLRALHHGNINIPLVVIGNKTAYAKEVFKFLDQHQSVRVFFYDVIQNTDLRGFYQLADVFVYPSVYEGFGIPILESLASRVPVITSRGGCFSEAGGPATLYVDPVNFEELAGAILQVLQHSDLKEKMIETGYQHAMKFKEDSVAGKVMQVYEKVMQYDR
jgi:glycosyltransferase involved in cell wall biosynthesis